MTNEQRETIERLMARISDVERERDAMVEDAWREGFAKRANVNDVQAAEWVDQLWRSSRAAAALAALKE